MITEHETRRAKGNFMLKVHCPQIGGTVWANSVTKDKTGQTLRCTKCGLTGHSKVRP